MFNVAKFEDYHEIDYAAQLVNKVFNSGHTVNKVKSREIGFDGYYYVGLFWTGRKPNKAQIKNALADKQIVLQDEDDD